jgi:hypothetical protein
LCDPSPEDEKDDVDEDEVVGDVLVVDTVVVIITVVGSGDAVVVIIAVVVVIDVRPGTSEGRTRQYVRTPQTLVPRSHLENLALLLLTRLR